MKNISELVSGDTVVLFPGGWSDYIQIKTVERTTKTQIILQDCTTRFNRDTGRAIGGSYTGSRCHVKIPTAALLETARKLKYIRYIKGTKIDDLPVDTLQSVYEIILAVPSKEETQ